MYCSSLVLGYKQRSVSSIWNLDVILSHLHRNSNFSRKNMKKWILYRGVTGYLKLGGQIVMWHAAAAKWHLLFCQKLGGQFPTLPTRQVHSCSSKISEIFSTVKNSPVCPDNWKLTYIHSFFHISYTWYKSLGTSGRMAGRRVYCIRKLHQLGIQKWPWPYLCVWFKYQSDINYLQFVLQITQGRFLGTL